MEPGQIVFSKRGHDRGRAFVVTEMFTEAGKQIARLADGERRTIEKPKRKNVLHIQETSTFVTAASDAEIRKALKDYCKGGFGLVKE